MSLERSGPDACGTAFITQIFVAPAVIAAVTAFGLTSALLGDGIWDQASWLALAVPLAVIAFYVSRHSVRSQT
ncbi:hypothetical protein J6500_23260 [Bradyrhizobium sp. WSM 1704]|uniref:hypothetical protein n=1 Tax=Bradyrhizobium semiaridum TaxID=2821404 RepID=UPI001CE2B2E7|nr:hypothetical protein [Bradyrhizobium semiaridum]MCA6124791.1 hypothetical protein [Bradyrhizobium semiaridum]